MNQAFELTPEQAAALRGKTELSIKLVAIGGALTRIHYQRAYLSARR